MKKEKKFFIGNQQPELINYLKGREALPEDFVKEKSILLLHGFASHFNNMDMISKSFANLKYNVIGFNYRSYQDITDISQTLKDLLDHTVPKEAIEKGLLLHGVGHSLGGVVLRNFVLNNNGGQYLKSIVMLGSPNNSALDHELIKYLISHIQYVSIFIDPNLVVASSGISARQLTKHDKPMLKDCFINKLNEKEAITVNTVPYLTIAAGGGPRANLRIHPQKYLRKYINKKIQKLLGDPRNDGLIIEKSVDLNEILKNHNSTNTYSHYNDKQYRDYYDLDHSGLLESPIIVRLIDDFLNSI